MGCCSQRIKEIDFNDEPRLLNNTDDDPFFNHIQNELSDSYTLLSAKAQSTSLMISKSNKAKQKESNEISIFNKKLQQLNQSQERNRLSNTNNKNNSNNNNNSTFQAHSSKISCNNSNNNSCIANQDTQKRLVNMLGVNESLLHINYNNNFNIVINNNNTKPIISNFNINKNNNTYNDSMMLKYNKRNTTEFDFFKNELLKKRTFTNKKLSIKPNVNKKYLLSKSEDLCEPDLTNNRKSSNNDDNMIIKEYDINDINDNIDIDDNNTKDKGNYKKKNTDNCYFQKINSPFIELNNKNKEGNIHSFNDAKNNIASSSDIDKNSNDNNNDKYNNHYDYDYMKDMTPVTFKFNGKSYLESGSTLQKAKNKNNEYTSNNASDSISNLSLNSDIDNDNIDIVDNKNTSKELSCTQKQKAKVKKNSIKFIFSYEIENIILWGLEHLESIYPEINLILIIEINDMITTQEKIVLVNKKEEKLKFIPLFKKNMIHSNNTFNSNTHGDSNNIESACDIYKGYLNYSSLRKSNGVYSFIKTLKTSSFKRLIHYNNCSINNNNSQHTFNYNSNNNNNNSNSNNLTNTINTFTDRDKDNFYYHNNSLYSVSSNNKYTLFNNNNNNNSSLLNSNIFFNIMNNNNIIKESNDNNYDIVNNNKNNKDKTRIGKIKLKLCNYIAKKQFNIKNSNNINNNNEIDDLAYYYNTTSELVTISEEEIIFKFDYKNDQNVKFKYQKNMNFMKLEKKVANIFLSMSFRLDDGGCSDIRNINKNKDSSSSNNIFNSSYNVNYYSNNNKEIKSSIIANKLKSSNNKIIKINSPICNILSNSNNNNKYNSNSKSKSKSKKINDDKAINTKNTNNANNTNINITLRPTLNTIGKEDIKSKFHYYSSRNYITSHIKQNQKTAYLNDNLFSVNDIDIDINTNQSIENKYNNLSLKSIIELLTSLKTKFEIIDSVDYINKNLNMREMSEANSEMLSIYKLSLFEILDDCFDFFKTDFYFFEFIVNSIIKVFFSVKKISRRVNRFNQLSSNGNDLSNEGSSIGSDIACSKYDWLGRGSDVESESNIDGKNRVKTDVADVIDIDGINNDYVANTQNNGIMKNTNNKDSLSDLADYNKLIKKDKEILIFNDNAKENNNENLIINVHNNKRISFANNSALENNSIHSNHRDNSFSNLNNSPLITPTSKQSKTSKSRTIKSSRTKSSRTSIILIESETDELLLNKIYFKMVDLLEIINKNNTIISNINSSNNKFSDTIELNKINALNTLKTKLSHNTTNQLEVILKFIYKLITKTNIKEVKFDLILNRLKLLCNLLFILVDNEFIVVLITGILINLTKFSFESNKNRFEKEELTNIDFIVQELMHNNYLLYLKQLVKRYYYNNIIIINCFSILIIFLDNDVGFTNKDISIKQISDNNNSNTSSKHEDLNNEIKSIESNYSSSFGKNNVISIYTLSLIFDAYRNFDIIHEIIISLLKIIISRNLHINNNSTNDSIQDSKLTISIVYNSFIIFKNKLIFLNQEKTQEIPYFFNKIFKSAYTILNILNLITNNNLISTEIIVYLNTSSNVFNTIADFIISGLIETKIIVNINSYFTEEKFYTKILNKIILFKFLIILLEMINKKNYECLLNKTVSEKLFNTFKHIEECEENFKPKNMYDYLNKKKNINGKSYEEVEKQLHIYLELYEKYKTLLPESIKNLISKIKVKPVRRERRAKE